MCALGGHLVTTSLVRGNISLPGNLFSIGGVTHHAGQAGGASPSHPRDRRDCERQRAGPLALDLSGNRIGDEDELNRAASRQSARLLWFIKLMAWITLT